MRVAVISDMHGNDVGFKAAMSDIDRIGFDQIVCLGDAIQGGPQPVEVVARLRDRNIPTVMGNADDWLLTGFESGAENIPAERMRKMEEVRQWMLGRLNDEDQEFIRSFSPTIEIDLGGDKLLCFHGSPTSFDDVLLPDSTQEKFEELLPRERAKFFCGGHTHVQFLRHLGHGFHFNPGSVGMAYRHGQASEAFKADPFAEYAILSVDGPKLSLEYRRIPFNVAKLKDAYIRSGRPHSADAIANYT